MNEGLTKRLVMRFWRSCH